MAAYILLVSVYGFTWLVAVLSRLIPHRSWKPTGRIMVIGTFHNPNWYLSHITPLTHSGVKEVILVVDRPQLPLAGVRFVCWPSWISRLLSRPGARAIWVIVAGFRYRPDLYIGYHIGPGACTALVAGKLMGRPTCYQMTGGPIEVSGGGSEDIEGAGKSLGHPSMLVEALALAVVRLFELVIVRGSKARAFLAMHGITGSVAVITGSVQNGLPASTGVRDIHLTFVGRLSPIKQADQFIAVVDSVRQSMPDVRAVIVGDGPLKAVLQAQVSQLKLGRNMEFVGQTKGVEPLLARSKVFVLTSKSEGLSIAMAEAMSAGVVPVVADVGELSDLVSSGKNGYLVRPDCIDEYVERVMSLLRDQALWERCSHAAIEAARECCAVEVVTGKWRQHIRETVYQASGHYPQEVLS